jgi:hypothetical protein
MAVAVNFYHNNKKINSTQLPTAQVGDFGCEVEFKDVTNLYTPSVILSVDRFKDGTKIKNPMEFNYCYIPDFGRYYFVRSWSWILGRWECDLEIDVLATFKTQIGNTTTYVLRSASYCDPDIVDTKYPTKAEDAKNPYQVKTYSDVNSPWNTNIYNAPISDGCFIISVVNNDSGAIGAVSHYALAPRVMAELMNKLYSSPNWMNITDGNISQDLQKMLINPMQYITNCMWMPCGYDTTSGVGISSIPYGWWSVSLSTGVAYRVDVSHIKRQINMTFPTAKHPQYDTYKHWLQLSPYTTCALYLPPFGFIPLDTSKLYGATHIDCNMEIDLITGRGVLNVSSHKTAGGSTVYGGIIYNALGQVGVPVSIAQMSVDWSRISTASTWVGAAGISLATGGLQDSLKDLKNGLVDGVRNMFNNDKPNLGDKLRSQLTGAATRAQAIQAGGFAGSLASGLERGMRYAKDNQPENSLLSSLKSIASDIGSAALAISGTCATQGSTGGFASLMEQCYVQWYFQRIADQDPQHYGYPCCKKVKINSLTGFVLCANADDFTANCTPAERQAVAAIMEAGFYYE